jgi:hypothetical protein
MFAIRKEAIPTRNYLNYISKEPSVVTDACRLCVPSSETIQRLIVSPPQPVQNTYKHPHDQVAKFLPSGTGETDSSSWETIFSYYKYESQVVLGKRQL